MTTTTSPTTQRGRELFTDNEPMDMWESDGVTPEDIAEVERQAAEMAVRDYREALRNLLTAIELAAIPIMSSISEKERLTMPRRHLDAIQALDPAISQARALLTASAEEKP